MNMPPITKNLIIINILFFLAQQILGMRYDLDLNDVLGLHFFLASDFHLYQLVTYMFMHGNFQHILFISPETLKDLDILIPLVPVRVRCSTGFFSSASFSFAYTRSLILTWERITPHCTNTFPL
jgi:hypothetical protein